MSETATAFLTKPTGWMGDARRGAAMGRATVDGGYMVTDNAKPFHLVRIRLDRSGYDPGGAYWGHGEALWGFIGPVTDIHGYVRGRTRDAAKQAVRAIHPKAKFFR